MRKFILLLVFVFSSLISSQNKDQVIQSVEGTDLISIKILDFETDQPIIGAIVYSLTSDDTLATTDIEGKASFNKGIKGNIEIIYVGYDPLCFKINNDEIDNITARIILNVNIGCEFYTYDVDSLWRAAENDAELDLTNGIIRIIFNREPTSVQKTFAENHSFNFYIDEDQNPEYFLSYNEVVLDYLSKKFNTDIRKDLRAICWRNYDFEIIK
jgi:hypothetical protein